MRNNWRQYQEDAAAVFRSLGFTAEVNWVVEGVRSKHEIDVYVTFQKWGMNHVWIVECKKHSRPITKADVETLKSIAWEVGAGLAFLLSESGFQSGAFASAQRTNVVLSSLTELRAKSYEDIIREALSGLEIRALGLQEKLFREFMCDVESAPGFVHSRLRDGVDSDRYYSMAGSIAMLKMGLERVRLGQFPVILPGELDDDPDSYARCTTTDQFVVQAQRVLERVKSWAAKQNPK